MRIDLEEIDFLQNDEIISRIWHKYELILGKH